MIKNVIKAYIAGLIDGEGCVSICRRKHRQRKSNNWYYEPQVVVANTDKRMMDFLVGLYGGWIATIKGKQVRVRINCKQGYHWKITGDGMRQLLKDVFP